MAEQTGEATEPKPRIRPTVQDQKEAGLLRWYDANAGLLHHIDGAIWDVYERLDSTSATARVDGIHGAIRVAMLLQEKQAK